MATKRHSTPWFTYPQTRARLAATLLGRYDREGIIYRLRMVGYDEPISDTATNRSLAYKLAFIVLPACVDRVKGAR